MKYILTILLLLTTACTDSDAARSALQSQGMTNVAIKGWNPLACGEDDYSSTGFTATNAQGNAVSGTVCCGAFFKSCTVRW